MVQNHLFIAIMASTFVLSAPGSAQEVRHERIEWSDIWVQNANTKDLPRALLVGDSITRAYYPAVQKLLAAKANCARYATSKFLSNPDFLAELGILLKRYPFAVIHINNGLHGWDYTEAEYTQGLITLLATLKRDAPHATVIWCMTTPVRQGKQLTQMDAKNQRVIKRNQIAATIMGREKISINNLYKTMKDHPEYHARDGVHYNHKGKTLQAKYVADIVGTALTETK